MTTPDFLMETPWDAVALDIPTYELKSVTEDALKGISGIPGHFTVKLDPLDSKELLHRYGFYYCDTLLEPYCTAERFQASSHDGVRVNWEVGIDEVLSICDGGFSHGRFHRDFQVAGALADLRYNNWLKQLHNQRNTFGLEYEGTTAAFFAVSGAKVVLHAVSEKFRGKGLAKALWSAGYLELYGKGHAELSSSVSACNLAVVNLYASLGFRFRNPVDVYHRFNDGKKDMP